MTSLTIQELALLKQFREHLVDLKLDDVWNSDVHLIRWLRRHSQNLIFAEQYLRQSLKWREENEMDLISQWTPPDIVSATCPCHFLGYDKENSPVIFLVIGRYSLRNMMQLGHKDDFIRYVQQSCSERALSLMYQGRRTPEGHPISQYTCIIDVDGLSMRDLTCPEVIHALQSIFKSYEFNYPELCKSCFFINTSSAFTVLLAIIRPFTTHRTYRRMRVFSANRKKWKKALLEVIPADQLPVVLGGCGNGPNPYLNNCNSSATLSRVNSTVLGGSTETMIKTLNSEFPENSKKIENLATRWIEDGELGNKDDDNDDDNNNDNDSMIDEEMTDIHVELAAGQVVQKTFLVHVPGSYLTWQFQTQQHNVEFSVNFITYCRSLHNNNDNMSSNGMKRPISASVIEIVESIVPREKVDSSYGSLACLKEGTYQLTFDNTHSPNTSTRLTYRAKVFSPPPES